MQLGVGRGDGFGFTELGRACGIFQWGGLLFLLVLGIKTKIREW